MKYLFPMELSASGSSGVRGRQQKNRVEKLIAFEIENVNVTEGRAKQRNVEKGQKMTSKQSDMPIVIKRHRKSVLYQTGQNGQLVQSLAVVAQDSETGLAPTVTRSVTTMSALVSHALRRSND